MMKFLIFLTFSAIISMALARPMQEDGFAVEGDYLPTEPIQTVTQGTTTVKLEPSQLPNFKPQSSPYDELRQARLEIFLHNYMNKLEQTVRTINNGAITKEYKKLADEYFKRLSADKLNQETGFQMGDKAMQLLQLSNLVLDSADIQGMKKAGALKQFLHRKIEDAKNSSRRSGGLYSLDESNSFLQDAAEFFFFDLLPTLLDVSSSLEE